MTYLIGFTCERYFYVDANGEEEAREKGRNELAEEFADFITADDFEETLFEEETVSENANVPDTLNIRWEREDFENALDNAGIPVTKNNLNKLYAKVNNGIREVIISEINERLTLLAGEIDRKVTPEIPE